MRPLFLLGLGLYVALVVPPAAVAQQPNKNVLYPTKGFRLIAVPAILGGHSHLKTQVIDTQKQFDAFVAQIKTQAAWPRQADFHKALGAAKLDFDKESLVLLQHEEGSSSTRVGFAVPELTGDKLVCVIYPNDAFAQNLLVAYHYFAVAVDKRLVSQVEVWVQRDDSGKLEHVVAIKNPQKPEPAVADPARRIAQLEARLAELTKELEALRKAGKLVVAETKAVILDFQLKNRKAPDVAKILQDLFHEKEGAGFRVAIDNQRNSVVVRCGRERMDEVEAVIHRLESPQH
jgi:hypothetical protein